MADRFRLMQPLVGAATSNRTVYFAPGNSTERWKILELTYIPTVTSAVHASNYATITPTVNSQAVATARTTNSSGGSALTAGTPDSATITGTEDAIYVTQARPLVVAKTDASSGTAVDIMVMVTFEVIRVA